MLLYVEDVSQFTVDTSYTYRVTQTHQWNLLWSTLPFVYSFLFDYELWIFRMNLLTLIGHTGTIGLTAASQYLYYVSDQNSAQNSIKALVANIMVSIAGITQSTIAIMN